MPLFNDLNPVAPSIPTPPDTTNMPVINTASMYSNFQYKGNIIGFLDGSPWTTKAYYTQFLGEDDQTINNNDVVDPTLKQYLKINDFELRVTTALSNTFDVATGTNVVTGSANVYPVITPMPGDIFIAVVEDGVVGVFEVTSIDRASMFKESAWIINYSQIDYLNPDTVPDCEQFVVGELFFNVADLDHGSNPLHTKTEFNQKISKDTIISELVEKFYVDFYDRKNGTFIVPNDAEIISTLYDPFLVKFWNIIVNKKWLGNNPNPIEYNVKNTLFYKPFNTVYDAILKQSPAILKYCVRVFSNTSVNLFSAPFQQYSIKVSDIEYVAYPYNEQGIADNTLTLADITDPLPMIYSDNFYDGLTPLTPFELLVTKVINKETVLYADVITVINTVINDTPLSRFYKVPVLIALMAIAR